MGWEQARPRPRGGRPPRPGSAHHRQLVTGGARQEQACRLAVPARRALDCSSSLAEDQAGPFSGSCRAALAEDEDDGNSQGLLARYFRMPSLVARTIVDCPKRGQDSSNRADGTCFQGASKSPVPFGQFDQRRVRLSGPACGCGVMGMSFISGTKKVSGTLGLRERHVSCIGG